MDSKNCCGMNLKDGNCPKPEVILLRQEAGTCSLACLHPCVKAQTLSVQVSISEAKVGTWLHRVAAFPPEPTLNISTTPWPRPLSGLSTPAEPEQMERYNESDTLP